MTASFKKLFRVLVLPVFLFLACVAAHGQQNSALSGTITDKSGAAVAGAHVVLKNPATGTVLTTDTNDSGTYNFPALDIGTYDLTVTAKGFETEIQQGLQVNISQSLQSNLTLSVGAVDQTVTVEANALAIQTDTNVLSTLVSSEQISEIATENRNVTALVALGLGVSSLLPDSNTPTSVGSSASISVNGLRESHNIWLIDGGEADDRGGAGGISIMPSQDSIAQIETLASNYPPDYGISSGATISLAIKSGTRHFHGEAWEFNRNTAFNANNALTKAGGGARQKLNYNIFGANIGGPLFIPHLYNNTREKTFFFWNEEWRRLIQGSSASTVNAIPSSNIPTAGMPLNYVAPAFAPKQANGSTFVPKVPNSTDPAYLARLAADHLTPGQPFPNNSIPANLFDPSAVAYLGLKLFLTPNVSGDQVIATPPSLPINVRDDVVRIDHNINDKWHLLGHYLHDSVSQGAPGPMVGWSGGSYDTVTSTFNNPSNSAAVKLAGTISPNLLVEASFLYDGNIINIINSPNANLSVLSSTPYKVSKYFVNGATSIPGVNLGGFYGTQESPGSAPWHNAAEDYAPKADISYTIGKHAFKFGLGYNRYTKNQKLFLDAEGDANFSGGQTGDPELDLVLGLDNGYSESQAAPIRHYVNQTISTYGYDTWQATKNLSLQIGLRYDALPHAWERQNQVANFNPSAYLPSLAPMFNPDGTMNPAGPGFYTPAGATQPFYLNGTQLAGVAGTPVGLVNNDYKTLQPRVGFSEKLDNKTVLRGGFGTFYERLQGNDIYNAATSAPFANTPSASSIYFSNPHTSFVTGSTAALPFYPQGLTSLAHVYRAPAVAQYSLGVQRELAPSIIGIFQYVGNIAWHQNIDRAINTFPLNTPLSVRQDAGDPSGQYNHETGGATLSNPAAYRTFEGYGGITQQENTTNGGYNGLQIGVRSAGWHGLSGEMDYTYSHEIDITSSDLSTVTNPFNLKADKASGQYDRRNIFSTNYVYKMPFFAKAQGLEHSLLGGWEIAGTFIDESGTPFAPSWSNSYDPVGLGGGYTVRPDVVGKVTYPKSRAQWYNPAQFSGPVPAWAGGQNQGFGDAGRDAIVGPGRVNFTTSLYKSFAITEHASFQFRAESFNTFNHTEFNGLDTNVQDGSNAGKLNSVYDPRNMEFGGKLIF